MIRRRKVTVNSSRRLPIKTGHLFSPKKVITQLTDNSIIRISAENTVPKELYTIFKIK